jgi:hypothetical protein
MNSATASPNMNVAAARQMESRALTESRVGITTTSHADFRVNDNGVHACKKLSCDSLCAGTQRHRIFRNESSHYHLRKFRLCVGAALILSQSEHEQLSGSHKIANSLFEANAIHVASSIQLSSRSFPRVAGVTHCANYSSNT